VGLFSSKKVTTTGTVYAPLMGEPPNLIRNAIIKATISDLPYVPTIVETLLAGYNVDPDAYYREGESGRYRFGLPQGNIPKIQNRTPEARQVIANLEGVAVEDIQWDLEPEFRNNISDDFLGRIFTQQAFADFIDPTTGISEIVGNDLNRFPTGTIGEYSEAVNIDIGKDLAEELLQENIVAPTNIPEQLSVNYLVYDPANRIETEVLVNIIYDYTDDIDGVVNNGNKPQFLSITDWQRNFYTAAYRLPDGNGGFLAQKYWAYDPAARLYPELEIFDAEDLISPYFPIVPVRIDKQMVGDPNHTNRLYGRESLVEEIEDILSTVGTDLESLQTALSDNPDVGDIDDAYLVFAIPFGTEHDGAVGSSTKKKIPVLKYCYRYFEYLHDEVQTNNKEEFLFSEANVREGVAPIFNVLRISDSELSQDLYWNYIEIEEDVRWFPRGSWNRGDGDYSQGTSIALDRDSKREDFYSKSELSFTYYNDELEIARRITVHGLYTVNYVIRDNVVVTTLYDVFAPNAEVPKDGFYLPIAKRILDTLTNREQDLVSFYGLGLVIYAIKVTKIKWYKRPEFFKFIRVVLFIVAVVSQNYYLIGLDLAVSEIAIIIIQSIIVNFLVGQALSVIFEILVDFIGVEAAFILAVIAIAYGASVEGGFIDPINFMPDTQVLLEAVTLLTGAVKANIQESAFELTQEFQELSKQRQKQEEEIRDLGLTTDIGIDLDDLVRAVVLKPERPDAFFRRTIAPDIGLKTLDTVDYYYDNALSLDLENI
jgi:hypothetical protein